MALKFIDGFDLYGNPLDIGSKWATLVGNVSAQTAVVRSPGVNSGALIMPGLTPIGPPAYVTVQLLEQVSTLIIGVAIYFTEAPSSNAIFLVLQTVSDADFPDVLWLSLNASSQLQISGTNPPSFAGWAGTTVLQPNIWYYVEFQAVLSSAVPANVCFVMLNGETEVVVPYGVNTSLNADNVVNAVQLGFSNGGANGTWYFDDFYVCDGSGTTNNAPLGNVFVESLLPVGDEISQWLGISGVGNQFSCVNEVPPGVEALFPGGATSVAQCVATGTVGAIDTFAMQSLSEVPLAVCGVQVAVFARGDASPGHNAPHSLSPYFTISGVGYAGPAISFPAVGDSINGYGYYVGMYQSNPATAEPWLPADIPATYFGFQLVTYVL